MSDSAPSADRYWFDNSLADEAVRLTLLEKIADPRSIALLNELGVGRGDRCVELGAGGGSMAAWLADRVGDNGSVIAVDRDLSSCRHLSARSNIELVEEDLEALSLEPGTFDLIHTRNVLMHVDRADEVMERMVDALRPGGAVLIEEADYYALAGMTSEVFRRVATPLVGRWTWARTIPSLLSRLPVVDVQATIDASMLHGGSDEAAFWAHTFNSARERIRERSDLEDRNAVSESDIDETMRLLGDPAFWTPFASVVCVSARATDRQLASSEPSR